MVKSMIKLSHPPDANAYGTDNIPTPKRERPNKRFNKELIVQSEMKCYFVSVQMSKYCNLLGILILNVKYTHKETRSLSKI